MSPAGRFIGSSPDLVIMGPEKTFPNFSLKWPHTLLDGTDGIEEPIICVNIIQWDWQFIHLINLSQQGDSLLEIVSNWLRRKGKHCAHPSPLPLAARPKGKKKTLLELLLQQPHGHWAGMDNVCGGDGVYGMAGMCGRDGVHGMLWSAKEDKWSKKSMIVGKRKGKCLCSPNSTPMPWLQGLREKNKKERALELPLQQPSGHRESPICWSHCEQTQKKTKKKQGLDTIYCHLW